MTTTVNLFTRIYIIELMYWLYYYLHCS